MASLVTSARYTRCRRLFPSLNLVLTRMFSCRWPRSAVSGSTCFFYIWRGWPAPTFVFARAEFKFPHLFAVGELAFRMVVQLQPELCSSIDPCQEIRSLSRNAVQTTILGTPLEITGHSLKLLWQYKTTFKYPETDSISP